MVAVIAMAAVAVVHLAVHWLTFQINGDLNGNLTGVFENQGHVQQIALLKRLGQA